MNYLDRYQLLLEGYQQGIYTRPEVVGQAIDMLAKGECREALWKTLTPEHREEITQFLKDYDEASPPLFPLEHWRRVKEELDGLHCWFRSRQSSQG